MTTPRGSSGLPSHVVSPISTSYPFLAVAHHHGVSYCDVLAYADLVPLDSFFVVTHAGLLSRLSEPVRRDIIAAHYRERDRQAGVNPPKFK